ncbi:MAG: Rrf2 family transcriptional regulator [Saprospirales bacterium]|nr:MAG: Rrf2 family transcriptional regulator [Saprospirales bacterium]
MKINASDEYGIRILMRIASSNNEDGLSISQLSESEGLSNSYVAKITRALRKDGLINSSRGFKGGYSLARPADKITINDAIRALGGVLYHSSFCSNHAGNQQFCANSTDCTLRSLWRVVQASLDKILDQITLSDLLNTESEADNRFREIYEELFSHSKHLKGIETV